MEEIHPSPPLSSPLLSLFVFFNFDVPLHLFTSLHKKSSHRTPSTRVEFPKPYVALRQLSCQVKVSQIQQAWGRMKIPLVFSLNSFNLKTSVCYSDQRTLRVRRILKVFLQCCINIPIQILSSQAAQSQEGGAGRIALLPQHAQGFFSLSIWKHPSYYVKDHHLQACRIRNVFM